MHPSLINQNHLWFALRSPEFLEPLLPLRHKRECSHVTYVETTDTSLCIRTGAHAPRVPRERLSEGMGLPGAAAQILFTLQPRVAPSHMEANVRL